MDKKILDKLTADSELWESRHLGASAEYMRVLSEEETKEIDEGMGLRLISIRLNKSLIDQLKELAKMDGIGYQPLIRRVLTQYAEANKDKLDSLLSVSKATEKAELWFTLAIKHKELIPTLVPLSNKRIGAECEYSSALTSAHALFGQAYGLCKDPVLKRHIKLRLQQIGQLCDAVENTNQGKKYTKKRKKKAS